MAADGRNSASPLRIAFLGPSPSEAGGVPYVAAVLLRALAEVGVEVDLYTTACPPSVAALPGLRPMLEPVEHTVSFRVLRRSPLLMFLWG
jgi:hypothetical protein